jgi:hypothetical protein
MGSITNRCDTCAENSDQCAVKDSEVLRAKEIYNSLPLHLKECVISCMKFTLGSEGG